LQSRGQTDFFNLRDFPGFARAEFAFAKGLRPTLVLRPEKLRSSSEGRSGVEKAKCDSVELRGVSRRGSKGAEGGLIVKVASTIDDEIETEGVLATLGKVERDMEGVL
jgi:hypothetical protein